ncbi:uncharacterized protein LOC119743154 [Patiria miniata]|uniref:PH domain-containing protein n=1 Tax=Patiria miniata TaxID=46514 RepID=A0A914BH87_PATMI|nr:uncharacterized protein LOC119743154 [Patiria miniata]
MMWEMQGLQDVKVSLSKENSNLKDQAARHVAEVSILKEKLRCSNQECRAFKCKIDILNELLHNKQGEVTQKDSALETKNTILEAIKTIAYTSPSPVLSSNEWEDAEDVVEQHTSTDIGTHCDNGKAVNRRQSTTRRNGCDVGGHNARPSKTCNKPSFADNSRRVSCKSSYKYKDAVQADQQSEIYTSDTGSWETDTSGPYQVASSSSTSYQDLGEQETSHDRRNDFIDEEEDDNESLLDSELSLGEGECVKYGVNAEGLLLRKQEQENYAMRSRDRCWHYVYVVQNSTVLMFYETREHKRRGKTLHDESPIDLIDALVTVAVEYTRRKHVFRVQLKTGKQYLFQARDDREMLYWVSCMDSAARCQVALTNGVPPSIASVSAPQLGSPSKSDRIKNAIKGSLSALIK